MLSASFVMIMLKVLRALPSDIWKGYLLLRNIVSADTQRSFWENAKKWAKEKGCNEFASDCELINEDSLKFHMALGFEEANRIICFRKEL